jgi:hypothetical protein
MKAPNFVSGLDLGQVQDPTALVVLQRDLKPHPVRRASFVWFYQLRHIARFRLGTPYTSNDPERPGIGEQVRDILSTPPLPGTLLAVDQTGVGRAVVDTLHTLSLPVTLVPITITSGHKSTWQEDGSIHAAKKDLVAALQVLFASDRLRIARSLAEAPTLEKELKNFRAKITTAGSETFEAWRDSDHDDLVLATAIAVFLSEQSWTQATEETTFETLML